MENTNITPNGLGNILDSIVTGLPRKDFNYEPVLSYSQLEGTLTYLMGKILTQIDASIIEERQNKAVKDNIKALVHERLDHWKQHVLYEISENEKMKNNLDKGPCASS